MLAWARLLVAVMGLGLLGVSAGCQTSGSSNSAVSSGMGTSSAEGSGAAPTDAGPSGRQREGGLLLRTGSIQLGPGAGRNAWRWQGDGQWGF